jgi:hypothetical protein
LLHQAQTKRDSKINRKINTPVSWIDAAKPFNGLIVHPILFHQCVDEVYRDYLNQLRDPAERDLRRLFRRKMNGIAGTR